MELEGSILIDIDHSGVTYDAAESAFLHRQALDRVLEALNAPSAPEGLAGPEPDRPRELSVRRNRRHDAVLVSARRGEGKTTFLTTVLRSIEDANFKRLQNSTSERVLYSLGIVDPTLIETKQNIIVVVVDLIKIAAEHRRERLGHGPEDFEPVQRALRKLAQGLTVLDGIGDAIYSGRDWVDADYVLDKGLENASAAHSFERSLQDYIKIVANYVGVSAFVLAIDDVDTRFESGWPVLEAIRKYLVTPYLRIILSGDLNLYSLLVRQQQWAQMTPAFLAAEAAREKAEPGSSQIREIGRMVDALQDQYLIKVAPPENRVELRSLEYHAERSLILLKGSDLSEPTSIRDFINAVSERLLGLRSAADQRLVYAQIMRLPVRSAMQVLRGVAPFVDEELEFDENHWSRAIDTLRNVAWTPLMSLGIDVNGSRDADPAVVLGSITEWMTRSRLWLPMARFYPVGANEYQDMAAIYYGAVLMNLFRRNPGKMVSFWVKVATVREKIDGGAVVDDVSRTSSPATVAQLVSHLNLRVDESPVQTVSRLAAWEVVERLGSRSTNRSMRFSGVTVPLDRVRSDGPIPRALYGPSILDDDGKFQPQFFKDFHSTSTTRRETLLAGVPAAMREYLERILQQDLPAANSFSGFFANGIEDLAEKLDADARTALLLPRSRVVSGQSYETGNYSILRLISVVGDLIEAGSSVTGIALHLRIERILIDGSQARSYPTPRALADGIDPLAESEDAEADEGTASDLAETFPPYIDVEEQADLTTLLYNWLGHHGRKNVALAPITLSRMWTRFTYAATNVRSSLRSGETRYLGIMLHRTLVAFLHAVGLEALRAADERPTPGAAGNPVKSSASFVNLLQEIYEEPGMTDFKETPEYAFFDLIFTCPLWLYYLAQPVDGFDAHSDKAGSADLRLLEIYHTRLREMQRSYKTPLNRTVGLRTTRGGTVYFTGLHALLNSVPIQGEQETTSRTTAFKTAPRGANAGTPSRSTSQKTPAGRGKSTNQAE